MHSFQFQQKLNNSPILPNEVLVLDNLIPPFFQDYIENQSLKTNFNLGPSVNGTSGISNKTIEKLKLNNINEYLQLVHNVYNDDGENIYNNLDKDNIFLTPMYLALAKIGYFLPQLEFHLSRVKINFMPRGDEKFKNYYNLPHVDLPIGGEKSFILIYYINDSDGDTFVFNENDPYFPIQDYNHLTISQKITPKKGRILLFRGDRLHASSHPINSPYRMVINYNIFPQKSSEAIIPEENLLLEKELILKRRDFLEAERKFMEKDLGY